MRPQFRQQEHRARGSVPEHPGPRCGVESQRPRRPEWLGRLDCQVGIIAFAAEMELDNVAKPSGPGPIQHFAHEGRGLVI